MDRNFTAPAPNRLWGTNLTMITTDEGPLWLSAIRDAFSRRVVAWETSARADADLALSSLEYALASREATRTRGWVHQGAFAGNERRGGGAGSHSKSSVLSVLSAISQVSEEYRRAA